LWADVVVVGAGLSGLYCAVRLHEARPDLSILVVEGDRGIGGRLVSLQMPDGADRGGQPHEQARGRDAAPSDSRPLRKKRGNDNRDQTLAASPSRRLGSAESRRSAPETAAATAGADQADKDNQRDGAMLAVEMGGMRLFPAIDRRVAALARALDTQTVPVSYVTADNVAYLRGQRVRLGDLTDGLVARQLYGLDRAMSVRPASHLVSDAIDLSLAACHVPLNSRSHNDDSDREGSSSSSSNNSGGGSSGRTLESIEGCVFRDRRMARITLRRLLAEGGLSRETQAYAADVGGYDFVRGRIAAAAGVREDYSLSGTNAEQHWVKGGYDTLAVRLWQRLARAASGRVRVLFETKLVQVQPRRTDTVCLFQSHGAVRAQTGAPGRGSETDNRGRGEDGGAPRLLRVVARTCILALPRDALLRVRAPWPRRTRLIMDRATEPWRAVKVALLFREAWWRGGQHSAVARFGPAPNCSGPGLTGGPNAPADSARMEPLALDSGGRNISDLAARQVWLLGAGQPPVALIYCDQRASDAWAPLLPSEDGVLRDVAGGHAHQKSRSPDAPLYGAEWYPVTECTASLVDAALDQITKVLGVEGANLTRADVARVAWRRWSAGTTFWRATSRAPGSVTKMRRHMLRPFGCRRPNIAIVGDSFAYSQGWCEGCLETCDLALRRLFALETVEQWATAQAARQHRHARRRRQTPTASRRRERDGD
jgi:hypothetical protein